MRVSSFVGMTGHIVKKSQAYVVGSADNISLIHKMKNAQSFRLQGGNSLGFRFWCCFKSSRCIFRVCKTAELRRGAQRKILCVTPRLTLRPSAVKQTPAKYYPGRHTNRVHNQLRRSDMLIARRLLQTEQAPEG